MSSLDLSDTALQTLVQKAIFEAITNDQRDVLIQSALKSLMTQSTLNALGL